MFVVVVFLLLSVVLRSMEREINPGCVTHSTVLINLVHLCLILLLLTY